jgi:hypothetical protein
LRDVAREKLRARDCWGPKDARTGGIFFLSKKIWDLFFRSRSRDVGAGEASRDHSMRPTTDGYPSTLLNSTDEKVSKASKAAKYVKKGAKGKLLKKRFSPTFHRPKTLKNARAPKYPRVSVPPPQKLDQFQVCNSCFTRR